MMCSATSFGCSTSSAAMRRSSSSVRPRRRVPAIGREMTRPPSSCTIGSGEEPTTRHSGLAQEVHVRARVHLAQHPVDVERVGVEVEVEALREHDLEDVAGHGCAPWPPRPRLAVRLRLMVRRRTSGSSSSRSGGTRAARRRAGARSAAQRPRGGRRRRRRRRRSSRSLGRRRPAPTTTFSIRTARWRQWSKAADLRRSPSSTASGKPDVVGRRRPGGARPRGRRRSRDSRRPAVQRRQLLDSRGER